MERNWHRWFIGMAAYVSSASKDPSTQVGAVVIDDNRIIRGVGYNGFPRGVGDEPERYADRAVKYKMVVHAEANALLNANGGLRGCTMYCTHFACAACAALIIQAGITTLYYAPSDPALVARWVDDMRIARTMFDESGIRYLEVET